ncbi:MAG: diguanylate cyclase [Oscillospiraceae bacterium]|nr:diguanylate cyclase [Oscillospiraceae bacterium]
MFRQKSVLMYSIMFTVLMLALIAFVYNFNIPNPNMILIAALVLSTSIGGFIPGMICAILMLAYSLFFFSTDHSFVQFTEVNLHKIIVITLGVIVNFLSVAILKRNRDRAGIQLRNTNEKLEQTNEELRKVNDLLKSIASKDSLTNLRNRYSLRQDFEMYIGIPLHVAFIDLDNFKTINDTKGHVYGDKVLAAVGKALTESFRTSNCYRYGGDEFLIIAEKETEESFRASFENVKKQLSDFDIQLSGGYTFGVPETTAELRAMIMQADEMLYSVKEKGKGTFVGTAFDRKHVPSKEAATHYNRFQDVDAVGQGYQLRGQKTDSVSS